MIAGSIYGLSDDLRKLYKFIEPSDKSKTLIRAYKLFLKKSVKWIRNIKEYLIFEIIASSKYMFALQHNIIETTINFYHYQHNFEESYIIRWANLTTSSQEDSR